MVFVVDAECRITGFTPGLGLTPFVPPEVFLGRLVGDVLPPAVAAIATTAIRLAINKQELQTIRYELIENGAAREYECRIAAVGEAEVLAVVRCSTSATLEAEAEHKQRHIEALEVCAKAAFAGDNRFALTLREFMVLGLLVEGLADKEIAAVLGGSTFTINKHVGKIITKMEARSRTEAAVAALRHRVMPFVWDETQ